MKILRAPLTTITAADIELLCSDEVSKGIEVEFKQDLPSRDRRTPDGWGAGQSFGEYARNEIAGEIVAFSNTLGGVVVLGIEESDDHPNRAKAISPIPRVHELARRLRQAVYDVIDPPLPMLDAIGVDTSGDGLGVVVLRVPSSRRKPHRLQSNREVYIRRADESVRIGMRQIQELTMQSVAEATRVAEIISDRRAKFRTELHDWLKRKTQRYHWWWPPHNSCSDHVVGPWPSSRAARTYCISSSLDCAHPRLRTFPRLSNESAFQLEAWATPDPRRDAIRK